FPQQGDQALPRHRARRHGRGVEDRYRPDVGRGRGRLQAEELRVEWRELAHARSSLLAPHGGRGPGPRPGTSPYATRFTRAAPGATPAWATTITGSSAMVPNGRLKSV